MKKVKILDHQGNSLYPETRTDVILDIDRDLTVDITLNLLFAQLEHDYSKDYLTFDIKSEGVIKFGWSYPSYAPEISILYSIDDGLTWGTLNYTGTSTLSVGTKVIFKGNLRPVFNTFGHPGNIGEFGIGTTVDYDVSGNMTSLVYGDNFKEVTDVSEMISHNNLFGNLLAGTNVISAKNLYVNLKGIRIQALFARCTKLVEPPDLSKVELSPFCFYNLFSGCTALTDNALPKLPQTKLAESCYSAMFYQCTSITKTPELPATKLATGCYLFMFGGCTSLVQPSELRATVMQLECYSCMFKGCTALKVPPELPSVSLAKSCYSSMFKDCTSLQFAPELPATTLAYGCYSSMFESCTSLISWPELPVSILAEQCYLYMFRYCSQVNYIKMLATNISASMCLYGWVDGVAVTGIFVKNNSAAWTTTGASGVPSGWTIYTESEWNEVKHYELNTKADKDTDAIEGNIAIFNTEGNPIDGGINIEDVFAREYLTFIALTDGTFNFSGADSSCLIQYSINNGLTWSTAALTIEINVVTGDKVLFKGEMTPVEEYGIGSFTGSTALFNILGNIMSLLYGDDFVNETLLEGVYIFQLLFLLTYCVSAIKLCLPSTSLTYGCYDGMFEGCTNLKVSPELPAVELAVACYGSMFSGCTSLTVAPRLKATILLEGCYASMFSECTSLVLPPELPALTVPGNGYSHMFKDCTSLIKAPELPALTIGGNCYYHMFEGCTSLVTAPSILPATTLTASCYTEMFKNCTSLKNAPELPGLTLAKYSYGDIFRNCGNINFIKMLATNVSATNCLTNWVNGVSATGIFVKNNLASFGTGNNGIPSGWTVYTESLWEVAHNYLIAALEVRVAALEAQLNNQN